MVPQHFVQKNSDQPESPSLTDAFIAWTRAALLALPLAGCASSSFDAPERKVPVVARDSDAFARRFTPRAGFSLCGVDYRDGEVVPLFSPARDTAEPLNRRETELLKRLTSPEAAHRYVALCELEENYLHRLEPVVVALFLKEHEGGLIQRASRVLREHGGERSREILCRELQVLCGDDLKRCTEFLREFPTEAVARAMYQAIRSSGFGEKEGRDEGMVLGKTLVTLSPLGDSLIRELLADRESTMQMAAAVSLASLGDKAALPTLLRYSLGDDFNLRREAIAALGEYPNHPEVLPPLERALKETDFSYSALAALKQIGHPALEVLTPYADPDYFKAAGVERQGSNPYLPGISYGEIVSAVTRCHGLRPSAASPQNGELLDRIAARGARKLIEDLDSEQLRPGAHEGFLALGDRVHPYLPVLLTKRSGRQLLTAYPVSTLAFEFAPVLANDIVSPLTMDACAVIAQGIRRPSSAAARTSALEGILTMYPEAPWLRHLVGSVWREDCDAVWTRAAISAAAPSASICEIHDEIAAAAALGIDIPLRWTRENLAEIVKNRTAADFDGRPIAAVVYAEADYNGAFGEHNGAIETLIKNGYCVMYYDESTDIGVIRALKAAVTRRDSAKLQPAEIIVLGAHSSRTDMVFGRSTDEHAKLSLDDKELAAQELVSHTLRDQGQIVLIACSAGEGRERGENIANMVRELFPHAKERGIWSTEVPDNIGGITLDPQTRELTDIRFLRGRIYRP